MLLLARVDIYVHFDILVIWETISYYNPLLYALAKRYCFPQTTSQSHKEVDFLVQHIKQSVRHHKTEKIYKVAVR